MRPAEFRFHPPRVEISAETRWVLLRAFGPVGKPFSRPFESARLHGAARALDLSARIAARSGAERLAAEIGEACGDFLRDSRRYVDESIVQSLAAQDVAIAARDLSIPLAYLKFQALAAGGYVEAGARGTSDVDVLVPEADAERFRRDLLGRGYRPSGCPEYEHQTSTLIHPFGVSVDIHRKLLGVRVSGPRSADTRQLVERDLCVPLSRVPGEPLLPARSVLVAHALAHGIAQHGLAPHAYPLLRMVADLVDLDFRTSEAGSSSWAGWISRDVSVAEAAAVAELCCRLRAGEDVEEAGPNARDFLLHVIAASVQPEYSQTLAFDRLLHEPTDHSRAGKLARSIFRAICPSREEIETAAGQSESVWRRFWIRLARPWVLIGRALR